MKSDADTRLWYLHHIGADEVHPAPDFETAWMWAEWANKRFADHVDICRFTVAIWPWSAERHAEGLAKSIEEWTLPAVLPDVYWSAESGNFYDRQTRKGMGNEFYREWFARRDEFPSAPEHPHD